MTAKRNGARVGFCTTESCVTSSIERLCVARYGEVTPNNMRALLLSYDGNGDGRLDKSEVSRLIQEADAHAPLMKDKVPDAIIGKMDTDGDRAVSWDEFVAASPQYAGATDGAAPEAEAPDGVATINRLFKPRISERNLARMTAPTAAIDKAAAEVKKADLPILPIAIGAGLLGIFLLAR